MKKTPQKVGKKPVSKEAFTVSDANRFFGSLTEHFDDKFKVINERIGGLDEKLDRKTAELSGKLDRHETILNQHTLILHEHSQILGEHSRVLGEHTQMIGHLMLDVKEIKSGMREK
jgi:hypothetical protein